LRGAARGAPRGRQPGGDDAVYWPWRSPNRPLGDRRWILRAAPVTRLKAGIGSRELPVGAGMITGPCVITAILLIDARGASACARVIARRGGLAKRPLARAIRWMRRHDTPVIKFAHITFLFVGFAERLYLLGRLPDCACSAWQNASTASRRSLNW